jgi:hypothetical protein
MDKNVDDINSPHFILIENMKDYKYEHCVGNLYIDKYEEPVDSANSADAATSLFKAEKTYYWVFDSPGDFALGHWIFESFIFIHILIGLNEKVPNIKVMTKNHKKYVKSMLRFFEINNEIVHEIDNYNNHTFFPRVYSINTSQNIETDEYYNVYLNLYINHIQNNIPIIQNIKTVFLPRNDTDNYLPNDRIISNADKIKDIVIDNGGMVLDTYRLNNIKYQYTIINNADTIILDYGSSLFFNCIFLKNKKIYVIDNQDKIYTQVGFGINKLLYNRIINNNEVHILRSDDPSIFDEITK